MRYFSLFNKMKHAILMNWEIIFVLSITVVLGLFNTGLSCFLKLTTGLPCPGCGMTRATFALLRFDFSAAFNFHPLVFFIIPFIIIYAIMALLGKMPQKRSTPLLIIAGVCMMAVYIVRMILLFPNTEPMTYEDNSILANIFRFVKLLISGR